MAERRREPRDAIAPTPRAHDPGGVGVPLDDHQVRRLVVLSETYRERYAGWGRADKEYPEGRPMFVDVGLRYFGATLHGAIGAALRAAQRRNDVGPSPVPDAAAA